MNAIPHGDIESALRGHLARMELEENAALRKLGERPHPSREAAALYASGELYVGALATWLTADGLEPLLERTGYKRKPTPGGQRVYLRMRPGGPGGPATLIVPEDPAAGAARLDALIRLCARDGLSPYRELRRILPAADGDQTAHHTPVLHEQRLAELDDAELTALSANEEAARTEARQQNRNERKAARHAGLHWKRRVRRSRGRAAARTHGYASPAVGPPQPGQGVPGEWHRLYMREIGRAAPSLTETQRHRMAYTALCEQMDVGSARTAAQALTAQVEEKQREDKARHELTPEAQAMEAQAMEVQS